MQSNHLLKSNLDESDNPDLYNVQRIGGASFVCPPPPSVPRAGKKDKNIFSPKNQMFQTGETADSGSAAMTMPH